MELDIATLRARAARLTDRELDVVRIMCDPAFLLEKEMPDELGMSLSTFKTHREHVYETLRVRSRPQLWWVSVLSGLITCPCALLEHGTGPDPT